jgi:BlaI family transcriptional regulator, penicillinase repressor
MARRTYVDLSRRERQIMDIIFRRSEATAQNVLGDLPDPPSYSAVRALLRVLEEKGHVRHNKQGAKYVYRPTVSRQSAARTALRQVLKTFFAGSAELAVAALLDVSDSKLSQDELDRLAQLIAEAKHPK